ncbi:MAG: sigma-70 family RNA polymerase sigma factor [Limnochordaceae bacterium]|nr:sigma-70 family RNA polymerase sigma factor [Limnochordaceae bacterium]
MSRPAAPADGLPSGSSPWPAPLPEAQLHQLFRQYRAGTEQSASARQSIIQHNLRLVATLVRRWCTEAAVVTGAAVEESDLFQAGCVGLVEAVDRFDPDLGFAFSTYAVPLILGELRAAVRQRSFTHWTRSLRDRSQQVQTCQAQLRQHLQREPTLRELAEACRLPTEQIVEVLEASRPPLSLSEIGESEEDSPPWAERVGQEDRELHRLEEGLDLRQALQSLPDRERELIELRFLHGHSQTEVGVRLGLSQSQVSRLERQALRQLRRGLATETEDCRRAGNCRKGDRPG